MFFYYYENQQDTAPKGFWDLRDCVLGRIKERDGSTRFRWKVTLKEDSATKEERILYTDTIDKRERWLKIFLNSAKVVLSLTEKVSAYRQVVQESAQNKKKPDLPSSKAPLKKPERAGSKQASGGGSDDEIAASPQKRSHKTRDSSALMIGVLDDTPMHQLNTSFIMKSSNIQEITELVSPRPSTACYYSSKFYDMRDIEKERNADALKSGRMLSLDEEWEEGENDWVSGEEVVEDEAEQCIIS